MPDWRRIHRDASMPVLACPRRRRSAGDDARPQPFRRLKNQSTILSMVCRWHLLLCVLLALPGDAQTLTRQNLADILGFENGQPGMFPAGWGGGPPETIVIDDQVVHSGNYSARIERSASSSGPFSTLTAAIPLVFAGRTVVWRGFIKTENVNSFVALWLREDAAPGAVLAFNTTQGLGVNGTNDWKEYLITVPVLPEGKRIVFGFLLAGTGKAWVDDLQLRVDGQPVAQAPDRILTVLDSDQEFDNGSGISLTAVSDVQV